jgi:hypothetical protein
MTGDTKGEISAQESETLKQLRELLPILTKEVKRTRDERVYPEAIKKK